MWNFLKSNTPESEMRVSHFLITLVIVIVMLAMAFYIVRFAVKGIEITHWADMGIFAIGIAGIATGTAAMKAMQKKDEIPIDPNTTQP